MLRSQLRKRVRMYVYLLPLITLVIIPLVSLPIFSLPEEIIITPVVALIIFADVLALMTFALQSYSRFHRILIRNDRIEITRYLGLARRHEISFDDIGSVKRVREHPAAGYSRMLIIRTTSGLKFKISASTYKNFRKISELIISRVPEDKIIT